MKNYKTNLIGILGGVILLGTLVLVYFSKVTLAEAGQYLTPVGLFLGALLALVAKDHDVIGGTR